MSANVFVDIVKPLRGSCTIYMVDKVGEYIANTSLQFK